MKNWSRSSLSSAVFYRHTDGVAERIERIETINGEEVTVSRPENLSTEDAVGLELVASSDLFDWWKVNGSANFFRSVTDGSNLGTSFFAETYSWFARLNSRMTLGAYDAPTDVQLPGGRPNHSGAARTLRLPGCGRDPRTCGAKRARCRSRCRTCLTRKSTAAPRRARTSSLTGPTGAQ